MKKIFKLASVTALAATFAVVSLPNAKESIAAYNASYLDPTVPNGYYDSLTTSTNPDEFKLSLNTIISANFKHFSYGSGTNAILKATDPDPNKDGYIICFYTGQSMNGGWNKEHVWAKSHGFGNYSSSDPFGDVHHLRPTKTSINSTRGHLDFGEVDHNTTKKDDFGNFWDTDHFEPRDEVKGDVARMMFYMEVRYGSIDPYNLKLVDDATTGVSPSGNGEFGNLQTLLKWNYEDPVSKEEIYRNNVIYTDYQHNRNPFIDHPEYVDIAYPSQYSTSTEVDMEKVNNVIALISQLPETIALTDEVKINMAKAAYDSLNFNERTKVTNTQILTKAINDLKALKGEVTPTPTPTPDPTPSEPVTDATITADFTKTTGIGKSAYLENQTGTIDGKSYLFSNIYFNGTDVRLGSNKSKTLDSKYNVTSNSKVDGSSLAMNYDVENAKSITFTNVGQFGTISGWYLLFSTDNGATYKKVSEGNNYADTMSATLDEAQTGRFALVIVGSMPRLKLSTMKIATEEPEEFTLSNNGVNTNLTINYSYNNSTYAVTSVAMNFNAAIKASQYDTATKYGIIVVSKESASTIESLYTDGSIADFITSLSDAKFYDLTSKYSSTSLKNGISFEVTDLSNKYTAVLVAEVEGDVYFSAESKYSVKDVLSYYEANSLITDTLQKAVIATIK